MIAPSPESPDPASAEHTDSHAVPASASRSSALPAPDDLLRKLLWTVPETAFMCRVGVRTVWRMVSDPRSGFPQPRRIRGRTLLVRDEVLRFIAKDAGR